MRLFRFETAIWLPRPRAEVFSFFSNALNLESITPSWVNFQIATLGPIVMRLGTMIDYKLRIRGIPILWRTEITAWEPSKRFVDEQRRGPYQVWCHEHRFEDVRGGTRCLDCVDYAVFGGTLINRLFVRRDIESIFSFRQTRLEALLGAVGK